VWNILSKCIMLGGNWGNSSSFTAKVYEQTH
jgi:hypothetical protein